MATSMNASTSRASRRKAVATVAVSAVVLGTHLHAWIGPQAHPAVPKACTTGRSHVASCLKRGQEGQASGAAAPLGAAVLAFGGCASQFARRRGGSARTVYRQAATGATIDRPPPPAELEDGDGDEEIEVRFVDNDERELTASRWLLMASGEDKELIEKEILPFVSSWMFTGKSSVCIGAFVGERCEGMATAEVRMDNSDLASFILSKRAMRCLALVTRPRVKTEAGRLILQAIKEFADERGYRADFEPLQNQFGGKYWKLAQEIEKMGKKSG